MERDERVDGLGDHFAACPRTGLLARRGFVLEQAWVHVVREAVGPEGRVVPQQWFADTTAMGVRPDDRRRLDLVVYGATQRGKALRCDATLVSPLGRDGRPARGAADRDGAALEAAARPKHARWATAPVRVAVEVGGRWNDESQTSLKCRGRLRRLLAFFFFFLQSRACALAEISSHCPSPQGHC